MLVCPNFFDGRLDGIGRLSGSVHDVLADWQGSPCFVVSTNDPAATAPVGSARAFGRRYLRAVLWAACGRLPPRPRAIVCTHLGVAPVARLLARRYRLPYDVFICGIEAWEPLRARSRWGLRGARRLLGISRYSLERFQGVNPGLATLPQEVVHLAVPTAFASQVQGPPPPRAGPPRRIVSVGRLVKGGHYRGYTGKEDLYKGFGTLVEAMGPLTARFPDARLTIVGGGPAKEELEAKVRSLPHAASIALTGRVPDERLRQAYAEADVFVLASEGEGFGFVFVEAMANGLPCVCVDAGAAPEIVAPGEGGLVARARDAADLADKIGSLLADEASWSRYSQQAYARFDSTFRPGHFAARLRAQLDAAAAAS